MVSEITGNAHDNPTVKLIVRTFTNAKEFADFEAKESHQVQETKPKTQQKETGIKTPIHNEIPTNPSRVKLGLNYTINLVLPKTDDPAIYDAIFKSLKDNLLDE